MNKELHVELIFVGFTNGYQILYANDVNDSKGLFYKDSEHDCIIPLYMLKAHWHRIESSSGGKVTLDMIKAVRKRKLVRRSRLLNHYQKVNRMDDMTNEHERLVMAAKTIFDNRLGWSDGRQPYALRELWVELGAAIYGDDDARVQELKEP